MKKGHFIGTLLVSVIFLALGICIIFMKLQSGLMNRNMPNQVYQFVTGNINFIISFTLLSLAGSVASVIGLIPAFKSSRKIEPKIRNIKQYSINHTQFTNRIKEFSQLFDKITSTTFAKSLCI